jgi:glycerate kinase
MKILVLPNAFKGSLSARETARVFSRELTKLHSVRAYPISDGGDGFIDFFRMLDPQAQLIAVTAKNAFLKTKRTNFLLLSDGKTAIVETARICGLGNTPAHELDPMHATSFGVGEVILKAVKQGAKTIYVGLGGVACNDGGAGMAVACGAILLDKNNTPLPLGAKPLTEIKKITLSSLKKHFKGIKIIGVADVTNPLLGPKSSAKVFGPQKGASPTQVKELDKAMSAFARAIKKETRKNIADKASTAAAGAIGAGLMGCFGAQLLLGSDFLVKKTNLEKEIKWADLVITTEGKLDKQTFYGKAPLAVLKLAKKQKKPVLFVCGKLEEKALKNQPFSPQKIAVLTDFASPEETQKNAAKFIRRICKTI